MVARQNTTGASNGFLADLIGDTTSFVKKFGLYLGAFAAAVATLFSIWDQFGWLETYGAIGVAAFVAIILAPFVIVGLTQTLPNWQEHRRRRRLIEEGVHGQPVRPGYFRLQPYDDRDHDYFVRADGAHEAVRQWILRSDTPILYLTGRSGTGKSSMLDAWVLPELRRADPAYRTLIVRSFADPVAALKEAIARPGAVWEKRPPDDDDPRTLLEKACSHLAAERLLIVFDQFEEFLILQDADDHAQLEALLTSLVAQRISGLTILAVLRTDYIGALHELELPRLSDRENWFEIAPFTRAAGRSFFQKSGLQLGPELLEAALDEAGEIEENPGLMRPITLNLLGVVLARFTGSLPKGTAPGTLIRNYLLECIRAPDIADVAPQILDKMISDAGTKQPRSELDLAQATQMDKGQVRGCLVILSKKGLVREIDRAGNIWEVSHDFVARLLGQLVARVKPTLFKRVQPALTPAVLGLWVISLAGFVYQDIKAPRPIEPDMVQVPAGRFQMGSSVDDDESLSTERPVHWVTFARPFAIAKYEVTFEEYDRFVQATERRLPSDSGFGLGDRPVINVTFDEAEAYAAWLSEETGKQYRLPTEAEWEYAARGGKSTRRPWGDSPDVACRYANVYDRTAERLVKELYKIPWEAHACTDGYTETAPEHGEAHASPPRVFEANGYGLYHVLGNVWEWVTDCWHANYEGGPPDDGRPWKDSSNGDCTKRVIRGGSWMDAPAILRSASRNYRNPKSQHVILGFRLVQELP